MPDDLSQLLHAGDPTGLTRLLHERPAAATAPADGQPALLVLLRHSTGTPHAVRECARLLLDAADGDYPGTVAALLAAGAPTGHTTETGDESIDTMLTEHGPGQI